jgi:pathogenesis-related protein 1
MQCLIFLMIMASLASATIPSNAQIQTFVNTHNYYRATVNPPAANMPAIAWLSSLATSSNNWASLCRWGHSGTPNVGENIYATTVRTTPANFNPNNAVNSWGSEKVYYTYSTNTCAPGKVCGHYTQIIWADSVNVGCAFQDCPTIQGLSWPNGGTIVVCQYSPPGNWWGERPYDSL